MKLKFFILTFVLLFARGCDFYSTSLWFFEHPEHETNLLQKFFSVGWTGLIIVNIVVVGLIWYAFYYYSFKYRRMKKTSSNNLTDFISELYFNEKGRFFQLFYKIPTNWKTFVAHMGYVLVRTVIVGSFLATFHNLCQFYQVSFYSAFRDLVGRPYYVICALILITSFYFSYRLWAKEYQLSLNDSFDER